MDALENLFGIRKSQKCFFCLKSIISKLIINFRKSAQRARRSGGEKLDALRWFGGNGFREQEEQHGYIVENRMDRYQIAGTGFPVVHVCRYRY